MCLVASLFKCDKQKFVDGPAKDALGRGDEVKVRVKVNGSFPQPPGLPICCLVGRIGMHRKESGGMYSECGCCKGATDSQRRTSEEPQGRTKKEGKRGETDGSHRAMGCFLRNEGMLRSGT